MTQSHTIGHYTLQEKIGSGGMGTVYQSIDTRDGSLVAIKHLKPQFANADIIERFKREGEALRALNHPNIVKMLDALEADEQHYLVMEYVAGGDLKDYLQNGDISLEQMLRFSIDLADALTRAHKLDIIHRDLKPANVLIGDDGVLRLTDFGVAYLGNAERVTATDAIVGTIDYLPPETFTGEPFSRGGDIWAFGIMLFEMLTGNRPFAGETIIEVIQAVSANPLPDLEALAPDAPLPLVDLIYRMLERDVNTRIASVRHVGAILEDILQGRTHETPARRFDDTATISQTSTNHNLPAQTTPFVGREAELDELTKLIQQPTQRLITVLAPGGMGKTRIALEAASRHLDKFTDGVYFIDLTLLSDGDNIPRAIADAIGFQPMPGRAPESQIVQYLATKNLLLVIDNWEHLIDSAALTTTILESAPQVHILATSRVRLHQAGETLFHLTGMDFPHWETPQDALEYAAVKLFMNGAQRANPVFELTIDNLDFVARICRLVAGMPLGIVLAASWVSMLSTREIADEIANGIDFLEATGDDVPERQQSIAVVFDYSWQLLGEREQTILMQLSIFRAGFTREAAQAITGASLRHLMTLVNQSLIRRDVTTGRYRMHELLRQFAIAHLQKSDLLTPTHDAHLAYFVDFLASRADDLRGGTRQFDVQTAIGIELENIRQAWHWASETRNAAALDRLLDTMGTYYFFFSYQKDDIDGLQFAHDQLASNTSAIAQKAKHRLNLELAQIGIYSGKASDFEATVQDAIDYAREHAYFPQLMRGMYIQQQILLANRQIDAAYKIAQDQLQLAIQNEDKFNIAYTYNQLGFIDASKGNTEDNVYHLEQAMTLHEAIGNFNGYGLTRSNYCAALAGAGRWQEARQINMDLLVRVRASNVNIGIAAQLFRLSYLDYVDGNFEAAYPKIHEARELAREFQYSVITSGTANVLGAIALAQNDYPTAHEHAADALDTAQQAGNLGYIRGATVLKTLVACFDESRTIDSANVYPTVAIGLTNYTLHIQMQAILMMAKRYSEQGKAERAAHLLGAVLQHPKCLPVYQTKHQPIAAFRTHLEQQLGAEAFQQIWQTTQDTAFDDLIAALLTEVQSAE